MIKYQLANLSFYEKDPCPLDLFSDNTRNDYSNVYKLTNHKNHFKKLGKVFSNAVLFMQ